MDKGVRISQRKLGLKASDLGVKEKELQSHVAATWRVLGEGIDEGTGVLQKHLDNIREKYLIPLKGFGFVILLDRRVEFDAAICDFQQMIQSGRSKMAEQLTTALSNSRDKLFRLLVESYEKLPPEEFTGLIKDEAFIRKAIRNRVADILERRFPTAEKILEEMECEWKVYNISEQILTKPGFAEVVRQTFSVPLEDLVKSETAFGTKPVGPEGV